MQFDNHVNTSIFNPRIFRSQVSESGKKPALNAMSSLPLFDAISQQVSASTDMDASYKARIDRRLQVLSHNTLNLLIIGSKGAGKSATVQALFGGYDWRAADLKNDESDASSKIRRQQLNQLTVWQADLPSENEPAQERWSELGALLSETNADNEPLIDRVIVVLDSASSNIDDCYLDICHSIVPMMGAMTENRLTILMNKADKVARHIRGTHANVLMPLDAEIWLDCTAATLRYRLAHNTGIQTCPLAYSALAGESPNGRPYNLQKLMAKMLADLPEEKRLLLLNQPLTCGDDQWRDHDDKLIYMQSIENLCFDSLHVGARDGDRFGGQLGAFLGRHCRAMGDIVSDTIRAQMGMTI
ncbi:hypothetical protein A1OK_17435 [Enterovibrio norvegicus FF-454]|uniref:G domain-containing protein n=1 Tax=Enterovibrio norvegicus FF-454 TaxID=1185651 RepID=A0A1E5BVX9_9GAMM|nr:hypothetical protein [Enterovibrio norvegicus]OEE57408.1 hypothetical protein A1OK_17435 [Enterovibrio norvegicus FF-454]